MNGSLRQTVAVALCGVLGAGLAAYVAGIPVWDFVLAGILLLEFALLLIFEEEAAPAAPADSEQHPLLVAIQQPSVFRPFVREAFKLSVWALLGGFLVCVASATKGTTIFERFVHNTLLSNHKTEDVVSVGFELEMPSDKAQSADGTFAAIGGKRKLYLNPLSVAVEKAAGEITYWSRTLLGVFALFGAFLTFGLVLTRGLVRTAQEVAAQPPTPPAPAGTVLGLSR